MRKPGASYSHVVNPSLALERYTVIGKPIHLGRPNKPKTHDSRHAQRGRSHSHAGCLRQPPRVGHPDCPRIPGCATSGLKIAGVDVDSQLIHVHRSKGQKDRDVFIAAPCAGILLEYRHCDRAGAGPDEALFVTLQKGPPYGTQDLRKFRHSLAANMLIRGERVLASKIGHALVETTMAHLHGASTPCRRGDPRCRIRPQGSFPSTVNVKVFGLASPVAC